MIYVYACGPMNGHSLSEANSWREDVKRFFKENSNNIRLISPTRGKVETDCLATDYDGTYRSNSKYIYYRDRADVKRCDSLLAYLPITTQNLSVGSILEIGWATVLGKPIFLVTQNKLLIDHPLISNSCTWIGETLEEAVEVVLDFYDEEY